MIVRQPRSSGQGHPCGSHFNVAAKFNCYIAFQTVLALYCVPAGDNGTPLTFCIGGPFGHGDAMRERANDSIKLSTLVLNHQARVMNWPPAALRCCLPQT